MIQTVEQPQYHAAAEHHLGSELLLSYADQVQAGLKDYVAETYQGEGVLRSKLANDIITDPQGYIDAQMSAEDVPKHLAHDVKQWLGNVQKIDPPLMLEDMASARRVYAGLVEIATYIAFERRHYSTGSWSRSSYRSFNQDPNKRDSLASFECDAIRASLSRALLGGEEPTIRVNTSAELILPNVVQTDFVDA